MLNIRNLFLICICVGVWAQLRTPTLPRAVSTPNLVHKLPGIPRLSPLSSASSSSSLSSSLATVVNRPIFRIGSRYSSGSDRVPPRFHELNSLNLQENAQSVRSGGAAPPLALRQVFVYYIFSLTFN